MHYDNELEEQKWAYGCNAAYASFSSADQSGRFVCNNVYSAYGVIRLALEAPFHGKSTVE